MKLSTKHVLEYLAVRAAAGLIQRLSYRAALALAWGIAWFIFYVLRYRVELATGRIQEVFGTRFSARAARRIAWAAWRNFCFTVVEMARIPVSSPEWIRSVVDTDNSISKILAHTQSGRGAIVAVAHMGSWEMAALTSLAHGLHIFSLAANQKNPLVNDFMNRMRRGTGFDTLPRSAGVLKSIVGRIRAGQVMAILPDVRGRSPGLAIQFLGRTANIAGGMGLVARMTGAPVFPCVITRQGWRRHRYRVMDPIWPDETLEKKKDWRRITQAVFDIFDQAIRAQPEQWFWFNKRWILDPLEPAEDKVPEVNEQIGES
ncbi:MAG: lysophospholipid acyltransferase family protein [Lentisphaerae bacterium]|nr:lysophospholipid acyltransferase family protein [Lentisphaerota bacterium]